MSAPIMEVGKFFSDVAEVMEKYPPILTEVDATFQFSVKGHSEWFIIVKAPKGEVRQGVLPKPDCQLEYKTATDFLNLLNGKLDFKKAILMGKLKWHGNTKAMQRFISSIDAYKKREAAEVEKRKAAEYAAAVRERAPSYGDDKASARNGHALRSPDTASQSGASMTSSGRIMPEWVSDASTKACTRCSSVFGFVRRKHHCRQCGRIFCDSCSSRFIQGQRTCDFCMQRMYGAPPLDGIYFADPGFTVAQESASRPESTNKFSSILSVFSSSSSNRNSVSNKQATGVKLFSPASFATTDTKLSDISTPGSNARFATPAHSTASHAAGMQYQVPSLDGVNEANRVSADGVGHRDSTASESKAITLQQHSAPVVNTTLVDTPQAMMQDGGVPQDGDSSLQERLRELEEKLSNLQSSVSQAQTLPEVQEPHVQGILSRSELLSTFIQPLLYLLLVLGWKVVPVALVYWGIATLLSGSWFFALLYIGAGGLLYHLASSSSPAVELFRRRMRVYGFALVVFVDYRITKLLVAQAGLEDRDSDMVWDAAHRRNAVRTFRIIRDLRGLWVKTGQYLSSRPDVMPPPYIKVLAALQDAMPARPLAEVRATMEEELRQPLDAVFSSIQEKALAAASIGQVHRGTLKDGTDVAIKVQHRGMDIIIGQDLDNLKIILSWLSYVESGINLEGIMSEWLKEVGSELDFSLEARNMIEVRNNMMQTDLVVTVPRVIPNLYSKKILVMRFIEGVKVNDLEKLKQLGVNRDLLCDRVCKAYAHQIYRNGCFNGDPHPGNIMIVKRSTLLASDPVDPDHERQRRLALANKQQHATAAATSSDTASVASSENNAQSASTDDDDDWIPVLLDFGLTKRLQEDIRLAFAKLVLSAEEMDYAGMLEAMDFMGMRFSSESAAEDLENLQYMFRDATPASEARAKHEEREKAKKEKQEKEPKKDRKLTAWPTDIMFYLRASELLQGLCSHLETRHPFMKTMGYAARMAFVDRIPMDRRMSTPVASPLSGAFASPLEGRLHARLSKLRALELFQGVQVHVLQASTGKVIANVAAGTMGPMDPRPVQTNTLFPVLGLSRLGVIATIQALVNRGQASYDDPVDKHWPAFGAAGKSGCTVAELLRGRSGVEGVLPNELSTAVFGRKMWHVGASAVAAAQPLVLPSLILHRRTAEPTATPAPVVTLPTITEQASGTQINGDDLDDIAAEITTSTSMSLGRSFVQSLPEHVSKYFYRGRPNVGPPSQFELLSHLWFGWGWAAGSVIAGMIHGAAATPTIIQTDTSKAGKKKKETAAPAAGTEAQESVCGVALTHAINDLVATPLGTAGQLVFGLQTHATTATAALQAAPNIATVCIGATGAMDSAPKESAEDNSVVTAAATSNGSALSSNNAETEADQDQDRTMVTAMAAMELAEAMSTAGLSDLTGLAAGGREHLMDPRMVNMQKIREALLPATNLYASAAALAKALSFVVTTFKHTDITEAQLNALYTIGDVNYHGKAVAVAHQTGLRLFTFNDDSTGKKTASALGLCSLGGSTALLDTQHDVAIAITTNQLAADRSVPKHILDIICEELKLGTVENF